MSGVLCWDIEFPNPVLLAAGTAGYGREVAGILDLASLGGLVTKAVSVEPRHGNAAPRVADVSGGMLNSVGLANPGLEAVRSEYLPWLEQHAPREGWRVIVNVVGHTAADFAAVVRGLRDQRVISAFELNVSCPNVEHGGLEFGAEASVLAGLVAGCRAETDKPLVVKLSPTLPDPARTATAAAEAGASGFTCINTMPALMYHEHAEGRARLGNGSGGLSGPALLPVGVRMTKIVHGATRLPVIGVGGIRTAQDARQYLQAGASLVAVGTSALAEPRAPERIARELARSPGRPIVSHA